MTYPTVEQLDRLVANAAPMTSRIIRLLADVGMRQEEVCGLEHVEQPPHWYRQQADRMGDDVGGAIVEEVLIAFRFAVPANRTLYQPLDHHHVPVIVRLFSHDCGTDRSETV
jgi:hypothetical protein